LFDTLVIRGGEFGRTPAAKGEYGRDHHPYGFTMWPASGGVKGVIVYGARDEFGWDAVVDRVYIHDLHLVGLNHQRLAYH
jgi:hypothetical protein